MSEVHDGFHARDGWYFRREDDGSVRIMAPDSLGPGAHQVVTLDADTWASAVASVGYRGESADTFAKARRFHDGVDYYLNEARPVKPTIGRIVHYALNDGDVALINQQFPQADGNGAYLRNPVHAGDVYAAMVVRVFDPSVTTANLQVLLDGPCSYWATSRLEGDGPGMWSWPPRA